MWANGGNPVQELSHGLATVTYTLLKHVYTARHSTLPDFSFKTAQPPGYLAAHPAILTLAVENVSCWNLCMSIICTLLYQGQLDDNPCVLSAPFQRGIHFLFYAWELHEYNELVDNFKCNWSYISDVWFNLKAPPLTWHSPTAQSQNLGQNTNIHYQVNVVPAIFGEPHLSR